MTDYKPYLIERLYDWLIRLFWMSAYLLAALPFAAVGVLCFIAVRGFNLGFQIIPETLKEDDSEPR